VLITQPGVARGPIVGIAPVCKSAPNALDADEDCNQLIVDHLYAIEMGIAVQLREVRDELANHGNYLADLSALSRTLHDDLQDVDLHLLQLVQLTP
jgi:hypothetical protein